jgi:hypothetical protein
MALSDTQKQILLQAKAQGLSKEQALARVFNKPSTPVAETRFGDVGSDIASSFMGAGRDMVQRSQNIMQGFQAGARGEQSVVETGAQFAGNILGGAGDLAFRGVQAATTPFLKESEERAIESGVTRAVQATGIPQAISETSPRTQRNITGAMGLFEGLTAGVSTTAVKPVTSSVRNFFNRVTGKTETPNVTPGLQTPEQVVETASQRLRQISADETQTPRAREEAAKSALTFKEKYIGLQPDQKRRLAEMGPVKLQEYLDAVHKRNIDYDRL